MSFWSHVSAETREGAYVTWYWGSRAAMLVLALHLVGGVAVAALCSGTLEERGMAFLAISTYGLAQGLLAAAAFGATALARRLAGWGLLAPLLLVPLGIAVAFYAGRHDLAKMAAQLTAEVQKHHPHATTVSALLRFPLMYFFMAPLIVLTLLAAPATFFMGLLLYYSCGVLLVCGSAAGGVLSLPILAVATWRRLRLRAQERTEAAGASRAFGDHYLSLADARPAA